MWVTAAFKCLQSNPSLILYSILHSLACNNSSKVRDQAWNALRLYKGIPAYA